MSEPAAANQSVKRVQISRNFIWTAALILLLGILAIWLISNANRRYFEQQLPPSVEVRKNPFLAVEQLGAKYGDSITTLRDFSLFDDAIDPNSIVIITNSRKPLSQNRLQAIKDFVEQGGFLILVAEEVFDDEQQASGAPLLDELDVRLYLNDESVSSSRSLFGSDLFYSYYNENSALEFDGEDAPINVSFNSNRYLVDASGDAFYIAGSEENNHLIQYHYGDGIITVFSDISFWTNDRLGDNDHAYFFRMLTETFPVYIVYNPQVPSLFSLTWQHANYLLISLLLFIAVLIWYKQIKTGPVFPQFSNDSRSLLQHIEAASAFKTRYCGLPELFEQAKNDLFKKIARRHHGFLEWPPQKQIEHIAAQTQQNEDKISIIFKPTDDAQIFTMQIALIQKIRLKMDGKRYE